MKYQVGDKVRIIKPLYIDNSKLGEIMEIIATSENSENEEYKLQDGKCCRHFAFVDEIELIEEFSSIKELIKLEEKELNNQYRYGEFDDIQKAEHYNKGIETIDYIESHNLNFNLGNAIKYITRCEYKKDKVKDLEKARYYIQREIDKC